MRWQIHKTFWWEKLKARDRFGDIGVPSKVVLKQMLQTGCKSEKYVRTVCDDGLLRTRLQKVAEFLGNLTSITVWRLTAPCGWLQKFCNSFFSRTTVLWDVRKLDYKSSVLTEESHCNTKFDCFSARLETNYSQWCEFQSDSVFAYKHHVQRIP
jgi:hypothetical protein